MKNGNHQETETIRLLTLFDIEPNRRSIDSNLLSKRTPHCTMTDDSGIAFSEQKKHGTSGYTARHLHQHTVIGKHSKAAPIDAYFLVDSNIDALRKCQGKFDSSFIAVLLIKKLHSNLDTQTASFHVKRFIDAYNSFISNSS